jgi:hypothetical protein
MKENKKNEKRNKVKIKGIKSINLTSNQSINNVHHHHRNPCSCRQGASEGTTPPSLLQGD